MKTSAANNRHGFTLIELVAVIVILSALAVAAFPLMNAHETGVYLAAKTAASDIRATQISAMAKGESRSITFTAGSHVYVYDAQASGGAGASRDLSSLSNGVSISAAAFTFNSIGEPLSGGSISLSAGGSSAAVNVAPVTGMVTVQ